MDFIKYIVDNNYGEVITNASFKNLTTIGCGGDIKYLYFPKDVESLCAVFKHINYYNIKYFIIGNGSNLLPKSDFYDGVVITIKSLEKYMQIFDDHLICSANMNVANIANKLADLKIGDLSFLCGIPGNVGGCVNQNSGAYGDSISNHLLEIKYIDTDGIIQIMNNKDLNFKYRYSIFKEIKGLIIEARFKIEKDIETKDIIKKRQEQRRLTQPLDYRNMGSVFKNPQNMPAWEIIDKLNLRGYKIEDACVSDKHANFLINIKEAKAESFINIINMIKSRAKEELNITLQEEIIIVE